MLLSGSGWQKNRKSLTFKIKKQVQLYLTQDTKELKNYKKFYDKDIARKWKSSSFEELVESIESTNVVLGGDFHPFAQAQRAHLRILRSISPGRKIIIALECLNTKLNGIVKNYVNGKISEDYFLKKIKWQENWGFPWENYKPIFDYAIKNNCQIVGISPWDAKKASLKKRDLFAGQIINKIHRSNPAALIYVIIGDLHVASDNLPRLISQKSKRKIKYLSVYFNPEKVYFDLYKKKQEGKVEVVKFNSYEFAYIVSPPWVKWQSYLLFLEKHYDSYIDPEDGESIDYTDHIAELVKLLAKDFKLKIKVDEIQVYSSEDREIVIDKAIDDLFMEFINNDMSFFIPEEGLFYLSRVTVNHSATLAGYYLHSKLAKVKKVFLNMPSDFLKVIWQQAMAFFLSKVINPKRKAVSVTALKKQLEAFNSKERGRESLLLAINHKMNELFDLYGENSDKLDFRPKNKISYFQAAYFLGEMLGEKIFNQFNEIKISQKVILDWLKKDLEDKKFEDFYFQVLKLLDKLDIEKTYNVRDKHDVVLQQKR